MEEDNVHDIPEPSAPRVVVKHRLSKRAVLSENDVGAVRADLRSAFLPRESFQCICS